MKKMNNKGFSLVELIIVIAIMAVLIGVMAPQFLRYVEQSRRSTDISNAQSIATAIQADIADSVITTNVAVTTTVMSTQTAKSLSEKPVVRGTLAGTKEFTYTCEVTTGTVKVYVGNYELYPGTGSGLNAADYKSDKTNGENSVTD